MSNSGDNCGKAGKAKRHKVDPPPKNKGIITLYRQ